jgi:hypothetical protein
MLRPTEAPSDESAMGVFSGNTPHRLGITVIWLMPRGAGYHAPFVRRSAILCNTKW